MSDANGPVESADDRSARKWSSSEAPSGRKAPSTANIIGVTTVAAIIVGIGVWGITEFVIGDDRPDAISSGTWAALLILVLGVVYIMYQALRSSRGR